MTRRVSLTFTAAAELKHRIHYFVDAGAGYAAQRLAQRFYDFVAGTLADYPATGRKTPKTGLWECWIPSTKLLVWHRLDDNKIVILRVWHT